MPIPIVGPINPYLPGGASGSWAAPDDPYAVVGPVNYSPEGTWEAMRAQADAESHSRWAVLLVAGLVLLLWGKR